MENLDIVILTSILSTLFVVFGVLVYKELSNVDENSYKSSKAGGPRVYFLKLMEKVFDNNSIPVEEKKTIYKAVKRTISDMESDGIYFPDDVKDKLKEYRDELLCEYSGLPSPKSYE
jgi:hypothetical protein